MKTLHFSTARLPILTFRAEAAELARDGDAFIIQAGGEITFQDTPLLEEFLHGQRECQLQVTEGEEELLQGRFHPTFLVLEQDQLAVRLEVAN